MDMDESVKSGSRLEVSVSFGRFENDALSWERWSSFSPNKYLEEVGSLSTPGSVAQKKAYFEAHYRRIAARKAEQLEQESLLESVTPSQNEQTIEDHLESSTGVDANFGLCGGEKSGDEVALETCRVVLENETMVDEGKDDDVGSMVVVKQGACMNGLMDVTTLEEEEEDVATAVECHSSIVQEAKKEQNVLTVDPELNAREEAELVGEEISLKEPHKIVENESENRAKLLTELKKESSKISALNIAKKVTPTKMERNLVGTKKKVVSPVVKPSQASTRKSSRPTLISTPISASQSGKKKVNRSPLPKSKNMLVVESKRASPTSLHMSLSLGPANSSASFAMTRKSLIMEKMGDKDIVKRAFKSFQNQINGYPTDDKSSTLKQVSSTPFETKIIASLTPRKENKGLRKAAEKTVTLSTQLGQQSKPFPSGAHKSSGLERKNAMAVSPSVGLKSDERAEKRKEFLRNLEAKSIAREAENAQLNAKSKEEKESEIRKLRQSLNFKATPMPSFYRGQGKGHSEKDGAGNKMTHHRPASSNW